MIGNSVASSGSEATVTVVCSVVAANRDILSVKVDTTSIKPCSHPHNKCREDAAIEVEKVSARAEDFQLGLLGHGSLNLLNVAEPALFLHLYHESVGDLTLFLVVTQDYAPTTHDGRFSFTVMVQLLWKSA